MSTSNQPQLCPACGQSNQCSLANPRTATVACWCFGVAIDPARLAALPADKQNLSCLCPRCAGQIQPPAAR